MVRTVINDPLRAEELLMPEQRAAIGCVAVESAFLEDLVTKLLWSALSVEVAVGRAITDCLATVTARLDLLNKILPLQLGEPIHKEFHPIYEAITDVLPRRNTVIHGKWEEMYSLAEIATWGTGKPKKNPRVRHRTRNSKTARTEMARDVMAIAQEIHRCYSELYDLTQRHHLLPPSPHTIE
jgi:hypothetical protein